MGYEVIWERKGVVKRFFGHITSADMIKPVIATEADPRFDDLRYVINDFMDVSSVSVSPSTVDEISAVDSAAAMSNPNIRISVAATHPAVVALARQYADSPLNAYPTCIFPDLEQARAWAEEPHTQFGSLD